MFFPEGQVRVHVYGRPVDMRKSFDGLYALTRQELGQDPLNGRLFVTVQPHRLASDRARYEARAKGNSESMSLLRQVGSFSRVSRS